ncbi:peptidase S58 family protein [Salipiger sp. IMCC34102]|uniref:P1 family peptidase n=1 Tax=Salipiger sp. IMCC34102 TaxID=2510647 RepID=UPI00101B94AF|nr:P1 family peptidase [Salipiger sp. IMCC34102]RYH03955.1 peptidase S58 family protein [Salipiger sp. IMCC34102]
MMRNLLTDVAGLQVGHAQDAGLKSGVTVVTAGTPFTCGVHVMGGAPGTRETDLLAPDKTIQEVDALVLSGGSALGLDAASGVANALRARGRGVEVAGQRVPIVPAAILFDLANGGDKGWTVNPYAALGAAALEAAGSTPALGSVGAGTGATTATLKGGLGQASMQLADGTTVAALVAVNALGSATVGQGPHFWAAPWERKDEFGGHGPALRIPDGPPPTKLDARNTTLGIVATDAALTKADCTRLATVAHDGFARALVPSHTPMDGDLVFALSHGERSADPVALSHAAATVTARAIARAIYHATSAPGDLLPTYTDLHGG